jgi:predicted RNA methylase
VCDVRFNISTSGHYDSPWSTDEHVFYSSVWYSEIFSILRFLNPSQSDVLIDIGCGKGRVTCCAARRHLRRVIGLDDIEEMISAAEANAQALRNRNTEIQIVRCKAESFDYSEATIVYMYNPFGASTMQAVLDQIKSSLDQHQREIKIAYVNPKQEFVMEPAEWLERYEHWPRRPSRGIEAAVSFWRTRTNVLPVPAK